MNEVIVDGLSTKREKDIHEWQQAIDDAKYLIEKIVPAKGLVCDPFLGTGTTALAAIQTNRKWIGIEINPEMAKVASKRIGNEQR
jgi:site-specific DNA-methyltransferase (adenine-specific)